MNEPNSSVVEPRMDGSSESRTTPERAFAQARDDESEEMLLNPEWQVLPARTHRAFQLVALLTASVPTWIVYLFLRRRLAADAAPIWIAATIATSIGLALWFAYRRYRYTFWKLDHDGFGVKRGKLWQRETRVPITRVQHLDIKRGPLDRAMHLSSLILHTAGIRHNAVHVSGMDATDAEKLRNYLSRQIDRRDGDEEDGDGPDL